MKDVEEALADANERNQLLRDDNAAKSALLDSLKAQLEELEQVGRIRTYVHSYACMYTCIYT